MISVVGILSLLLVGFLLSKDKGEISWRTVLGAFGIQAALGALVLYVPAGKDFLSWLSAGVSSVLGFAGEGINFLFGDLGTFGSGFIFAIHVLPVIIFFSSLIAVLYYLGVMQKVVAILGGGLQKVLGTSRTESLSAAANVFVGQTEAPLVVKPYIKGMTNSQLFAVMVGGLASVAGSVLAGYAGLGVKMEYLLAASFMAAPGGLLFAKLIMPETETVLDKPLVEEDENKPVNVFDAAAQGAAQGLHLCLNVGAMLLAFLGLIAMFNALLGNFGTSMEEILGWIFMPVAWLLGVPWGEAATAGSFLGQKLVVNEFVAYLNFAPLIGELSAKTEAIISFALCGFANFSCIAILLGGLGAMAPERRPDIARMGVVAVLAATLSNLMSAALAGLFLSL